MTSALSKYCLFVGCAIPLCFQLQTLQADPLYGLGSVSCEIRELPPFSKIVVDNAIHLYFHTEDNIGLKQSSNREGERIAKVEAEKNLLPCISTDVKGETLHIFFNKSIKPSKQISVFLSARDIEEVAAHGTATLASSTPMKSDRLTIRASGISHVTLHQLFCKKLTVAIEGSSTVELKGEVAEQSVSIRGAAIYRASALAAEQASVSISGAGKAFISVKEKLNLVVTGAGYLGYRGDPEIEKSVSGLGRLEKL